MTIQKFIKKYGFPQIIFTDFDGCLTNDLVHVDLNGLEYVSANRKDGLAAAEIKLLNIQIVIVSKEKNQVVTARGKKIGVQVLQGIDDKKNVVIEYAKNHQIDLNKCWFIGNDRNDVDVMQQVGLGICPSDAVKVVRKISDHKLKTKGGSGILVEILEELEFSKVNRIFKIRNWFQTR